MLFWGMKPPRDGFVFDCLSYLRSGLLSNLGFKIESLSLGAAFLWDLAEWGGAFYWLALLDLWLEGALVFCNVEALFLLIFYIAS